MQRAIVSISISISVSILSATALAAQTSANAFVEFSLTRADDLQFQRGIFEHQISSDRAALDAGGSGAWSTGRLTLAGSAALRDIGRGLFADSVPLLAEVGVEARYRVKESAHLFAWAGGMGDIGEASRALSYQAARLLSDHEPTGEIAVSMAKLHAAGAVQSVAAEVLQLHGGYGQIEESPVPRYYRDVAGFSIGAGTSEIMREIISRSLIKERESQ